MQTISAKELNQIMERDDDWVLLDVLPPESYEKQHIPGAYNAPLNEDDFEQRAEKLIESRDAKVIVYCADSECSLSPEAGKQLEERGFSSVLDFEGGLEEWKEAGLPTTSDVKGNGGDRS
jgi:rhodanese-related sulfurtransferase